MRAVLVLLAAVIAAAIVYSVPVALEVQMLRWHVDPWLFRVCAAEVPALAVLFLLGQRSRALAVVSLSGVAEGVALMLGLGRESSIVAFISVPAALLAAAAAMRIALRFTVAGEENL